jgi:hypothetical protein
MQASGVYDQPLSRAETLPVFFLFAFYPFLDFIFINMFFQFYFKK